MRDKKYINPKRVVEIWYLVGDLKDKNEFKNYRVFYRDNQNPTL